MLLLSAVLGYYYVTFSRMIDARLQGEMQRVDPRVFARPFELRRGQSTSQSELIERLNELGYAHRAQVEAPGEFTIGRDTIVFSPRDGERKGRIVRVSFAGRTKTREPSIVGLIEIVDAKIKTDVVRLDPPVVTALISTGREKRRDVPLQVIPKQMVQAVLAIEDRRFYDHPASIRSVPRARFSPTSSETALTSSAAAPSPSSSSRTSSSLPRKALAARCSSGSCR